MTNVSGASNYLNNRQLMAISDNVAGVSKTSNASIFGDVKSLDENKNEVIERPEAGIAKLVALGNVILNKLANIFGIELNKSTESQQLETFEDAQNEQIIDKYFKPLSEKVMTSSATDMDEGALDNMVDNKHIKYTYDYKKLYSALKWNNIAKNKNGLGSLGMCLFSKEDKTSDTRRIA